MRPWIWALLLLPGLGIRPLAAQPLDLSQGGPITVTALGGIEWRQNQQVVIAHGDARAIRGAVTVTADRLIAHYRPKTPEPGAEATAPPTGANGHASVQPASAADAAGLDTGGQQIYRLDAVGHVHIFTATDQAFADRAVYDLDQSVLVLTGGHLKLTTPQDVLTARNDLEYWPEKHMAVARGDAVVTTNDGRRLSADTLVAFTTTPTAPPGAPPTAPPAAAPTAPPGATPAATRPPAAPADPLAASGQIKRVEAFGHVTVSTATETVTGDRGVYVPATGIALILGNVRITRGKNQLNGARAVMDVKTGVADLLSTPGERVQGLVVPNTVNNAPPAGPGPPGNPSPGHPTGQPAGQPAKRQ